MLMQACGLRGSGLFVAVIAAGLVTTVTAMPARAAGGGFAVDDSEIGKPGECKVESWFSYAANDDLAAVTSPACVAKLGIPVELGVAIQRSRGGGEWGTDLAVKGKINLLPVETGRVGIGISAATMFDLVAHQNSGTSINVPVTFQISEQLRANVNGGWTYDNVANVHYATWGAGLEWNLVKPLTLIGEVYGIVGNHPDDESKSLTDPRAQVGLRYTPRENLDLDVIWGHNIGGEGSSWVTGGVNVRF